MEEWTAYHEAGHALMATLLGGSVHHVTIEPDNDDGPARYGDTLVSWPGFRDPRALLQAEILVLLSGPIAEMLYRGEPLHPGFVPEWAEDWRQAWERAGTFVAEPQRRLRQMEQWLKQLYQEFDRPAFWAAVAALADELLAHETLDQEMVEETVAQWSF